MTIEREPAIGADLRVGRPLLPAGAAGLAVKRAATLGVPSMSEETPAELRDALSRRKFDRYASKEGRRRYLLKIERITRLVPVTRRIAVRRDPKGDKLIDVALNGGAEPILSGDEDSLAPRPFRGVAILSPSAFLSEHSASAPPEAGRD